MIYEVLDRRIAESIKLKANPNYSAGLGKYFAEWSVNFWKSVKTEMVNEVHNGVNLPDDKEEIRILKRMLKQRIKANEEFSASSSENAQMNMAVNDFEIKELKALLPNEPSEEEVKNETLAYICSLIESGTEINNIQRQTKNIISSVKEKYPNADNGLIARTIKEYIETYKQ